ncbi:MAG TPA: S8 family peptidase [Sphingomonadaceae bacterium]|nr:S8 family peptidase [Sphingomonadaceae bacterium]
MRPPQPTDTIGYNDAEYRNSNSVRFHGAATAWVGGHTGQGSVIGIIDSGIFQANSEFAGRISPDSTDIISSRGVLEGEGDHGTLVAMVAAAANDGQGTVGIAYDATILAIRADTPGTCATECTFGDISVAIDYAVDHGAKVINISLGGSGASSAEVAAVQRASQAGVVVVVAAGNDGETRPDAFARGLTGQGFDNVIIAGAVDGVGNIADFSNQASSREQYFLSALGDGVTVYLNGPQWAGDPNCPSPNFCSISGTSFAAPQIAGAVALIAQAFPNMTGAEIVELLFSTAQDVGTPGVDKIYGHGILDIYEAFQPQGTTTLAGKSSAALPLTDTTAVGSPAMGDALTSMSVNTLVLDKYRRAYNFNIGLSMRGAVLTPRLYDAIGGETRFLSSRTDAMSLAYTIDASNPAAVRGMPGQLMLTTGQAETARVLAARVALQLAPDTQFGFAYAERPDGLVMQMQGQDRPAFLIARQSGSEDGTVHRATMSLALRKQLGAWGLTFAGESGEVLSGNTQWLVREAAGSRTEDKMRSFSLLADRRWGGLQAALGLDWMQEDRTVLGGRFHEAFGGGGANTLFVDASSGLRIAPGWKIYGALRNGWTFADSSSVIENGSVIYSRAWSVDLERAGLFSGEDRIGLRIAQPLRVEGGGLRLSLPVAYSYDTESATFGTIPLSLTPDGREIVGELAWHGPLWGGSASASIYYRREPGHYEAMPDDRGVALRWNTGF